MKKKHKQCHTVTYPGKKVLVVLKNGERFVDKFRRKEKEICHFDNHQIRAGDMRTMTIFRDVHKPWEEKRTIPISDNLDLVITPRRGGVKIITIIEK